LLKKPVIVPAWLINDDWFINFGSYFYLQTFFDIADEYYFPHFLFFSQLEQSGLAEELETGIEEFYDAYEEIYEDDE